MFGYVTANWEELTQQQKDRYGAVYCGICRHIGSRASQTARMSLSYDMAFLALLLMSLNEPEELPGADRCIRHMLQPKAWVQNPYTAYAADMNVALAYYKALDDWHDDGSHTARILAKSLEGPFRPIAQRWPRQCTAIARCIEELRKAENRGETNPDIPAGLFGQLMAELMVCREDFWAEPLRALGFHLGRFIYLADAMVDYDKDEQKQRYNPLLAMGAGKDWGKWEQYLVLAMAGCTASYEKLPLVQDKALLDNILYSGVWVQLHHMRKKEEDDGSGSL